MIPGRIVKKLHLSGHCVGRGRHPPEGTIAAAIIIREDPWNHSGVRAVFE
jgi:hypothetical protein